MSIYTSQALFKGLLSTIRPIHHLRGGFPILFNKIFFAEGKESRVIYG